MASKTIQEIYLSCSWMIIIWYICESHQSLLCPLAVWKLCGQSPTVCPWGQRWDGFAPPWRTGRKRWRRLGGGEKEHDLEETQGQISTETFCSRSRRQQQVSFSQASLNFLCQVDISLIYSCQTFIIAAKTFQTELYCVFIESFLLLIDSVRSLKGERGVDKEVLAPVGITVTTDDGRILGNLKCNTPLAKYLWNPLKAYYMFNGK